MSDKPAVAPHVDIVKAENGFFAVVHPFDRYMPQLVSAPTLDDLHRRLVSVLVSEYRLPQEVAEAHVASNDGVRHVEDTIMAAHQRGVLGMSKQLQDANKALAAAKAELEALRKPAKAEIPKNG
jgi:hypothetical protein